MIALAFLPLLPFVAFPLLVAAAAGHPVRLKPTRRTLFLIAVAVWASFHAYVRSDEKGEPPEPPEPPPGPYIPEGSWEMRLHRDPFSGKVQWERHFILPPSHPEIPVVQAQ